MSKRTILFFVSAWLFFRLVNWVDKYLISSWMLSSPGGQFMVFFATIIGFIAFVPLSAELLTRYFLDE